ncbi:MAG TPA: hypothetical protein VJQ25_10180 [Nitrospira sp.]|nr:hypothetical protein [Nitrospira sp.]
MSSSQHFQINNAPADLVKRLRVEAILSDQTTSEYVVKILQDYFEAKDSKDKKRH